MKEIPIKYHRMDNLYKYNVNEPLLNFEVKEKLDGANFRFQIYENEEEDTWGITFGSRNVSPIGEDAEGGDHSQGEGKAFKPYMAFVRKRVFESVDTFDTRLTHLIFFTEAMIPHKIKYHVPEDKLVIGYDVYDLLENKWRSDWKELFEALGIPTVPVVPEIMYKNKTPQMIAEWIEEEQFKSELDATSPIEGVVMVDYDLQQFYKYKTKRFQETVLVKKIKSDSSISFFEKYCTNYRIEKIIKKMELEGKYNPRNPLATLIQYILMDVFEEATMKDITMAFGNPFRSKIAQQITTNPELMKSVMELKKYD